MVRATLAKQLPGDTVNDVCDTVIVSCVRNLFMMDYFVPTPQVDIELYIKIMPMHVIGTNDRLLLTTVA